MKKVIKSISIALLIIAWIGVVAFLGYAYTEQYRWDGTSWYLRSDDDQSIKTFTKYGTIEDAIIYSYGIEKLWFQTFSAKGIRFEDYIAKPHMTLKKLLGEYDSKKLTKDIIEYNINGTPLTKFVKYKNNLIAIGITEDSEKTVELFKKYSQ